MAAPAPVPDRKNQARAQVYALVETYEEKRRLRSRGSLLATSEMNWIRWRIGGLCRTHGLAFPWLDP